MSPSPQRPGWLGRVFQERYHARALGTPSEVRNAIRYVYANAEHHFGSAAQPSGVVDPYSSAEHVLSGAVLGSAGRRARAGPRGSADRGDVLPVVRARGWLLDRGWRRAGGDLAREGPRVPGGGRNRETEEAIRRWALRARSLVPRR